MALDKNQIAQRIAQEVKDGYYVNLGIGIPTLVANYVRNDISVEFQSENGVLDRKSMPILSTQENKRLLLCLEPVSLIPLLVSE